MSIRNILNGTISISLFNQGKAGKIFELVRKEGPKVVVKNNVPECVLMSPEEYIKLENELEEARLFKLAMQRMKDFDLNKTIPASEVYEKYGIDQDDIDSKVEFE